MKTFLFSTLTLLACSTAIAQNVGINNSGAAPDISAMLDIVAANKGLLVPRVALTGTGDAATVPTPQTSLLVYNTATAGVSPNNVVPGYYYNAGTAGAPAWIRLANGNGASWLTTGNAGTISGTHFLGTTDAVDFAVRTNNLERMRILSGGNVGIGTTTPVQLLDVNGKANTLTGYNFGNVQVIYNTSTDVYANIRVLQSNSTINDGMYINYNSTGTTNAHIRFYADGTTERMRILANNGRVAINNTAPEGRFDVRDNFATALASYASIVGNNSNGSGTGSLSTGQGAGFNALVAGSGSAATGVTTAAYFWYTTGGVGQAQIVQDAFGAQWQVGAWTGAVYRKIVGTGSVSTVVKDLNNEGVMLNCIEAPEHLFQDYGTGKLTNGKAHITIDPILTKNIVIDEKHPLKVFVQLEGDCNGVFVTNKSVTGFDVVELGQGTSNVEFSYTLVATRANELISTPDGSKSRVSDYSNRFEKALPYQENLQSQKNK